MKTLFYCRKSLLLFILSGLTLTALSQTTPETLWTEQKASKWIEGKEWKKGLKLNVHTSVNKVEFASQYHKNQIVWDKAFAFLRDSDISKLKPGKYTIDGSNVYATITEAPSKEFNKSVWESHRNYIDLQYIINGKEKIGVAPISAATVTKPYSETNDSANYTANGQYYIAMPGTFFLFFPGDAHRPNIKVEGYDVVKKIVIKIKVVN